MEAAAEYVPVCGCHSLSAAIACPLPRFPSSCSTGGCFKLVGLGFPLPVPN